MEGEHEREGWSPQHEGTLEEHAAQHSAEPREAVSRRTFLFKMSLALNAIVGVAIATPVVRYLLGPVRRDQSYQKWIPLGKVTDYAEGDTVLANFRNPYTQEWDGQTANASCYVRRDKGTDFKVFAVNCAHMNCPVRWFPQSKLFMCPCHGGVYYADGSRAAGPPERGLFEYPVRVDGGMLMIRAGQMPTLSNQAKLVKGIAPCPGSKTSTIG